MRSWLCVLPWLYTVGNSLDYLIMAIVKEALTGTVCFCPLLCSGAYLCMYEYEVLWFCIYVCLL